MNPTAKIDIDSLLQLPLNELIFQANQVREDCIGNKIELCSIINAKSGLCSQDCKFCAQSSRYPTDIPTYPLKSKEQIIATARYAQEIGAERFGIVTSGNRLNLREVDIIAEAVREIENKVGIKVCASLGALEQHQLRTLKEAGLSRYHHNIETSARFYSQVISSHSFAERLNTIEAAKTVGLEVCSGGIIGMGEAWQDRIDLIYLLRDLDVDAIPVNFLVPIRGTPLESVEPISSNDALRSIGIFRIILEDKIIKIAAGRESILKHSQDLGFMAGANGMLIGGYLTVKGNDLQTDYELIQDIKKRWTK